MPAWLLAIPAGCAGCCAAPPGAPPEPQGIRPVAAEAPAVAQPPGAPLASWVPMAVGERWVYAMSWNGIPVGTASIEATDIREIRGRRALHIACATQANAYIQALYHLKDEVATDLDLETGLPLRFSKHIEEGSRRKDEYIEFDHPAKTATYFRREEGEKDFKPALTMAIPEGAQDPLSCLFRVRALPLKEGEDALIRVNTDEKVYETHVPVVRRQPIYLSRFGDLAGVLVEPVLEYEGIFPNKGKLHMWLEERSRIPLRLSVEIKIGSVYGDLVERSGGTLPLNRIPRIPDSERIKGRPRGGPP